MISLSLAAILAFLMVLLTIGTLLHRRSADISKVVENRDAAAAEIVSQRSTAINKVVAEIPEGKPADDVLQTFIRRMTDLLPGRAVDATWHNKEIQEFVDCELNENVRRVNRRTVLHCLYSIGAIAIVTSVAMAVLYHFHSAADKSVNGSSPSVAKPSDPLLSFPMSDGDTFPADRSKDISP